MYEKESFLFLLVALLCFSCTPQNKALNTGNQSTARQYDNCFPNSAGGTTCAKSCNWVAGGEGLLECSGYVDESGASCRQIQSNYSYVYTCNNK